MAIEISSAIGTDGKNIYNVSLQGGDSITMRTADTYVDKDIVIKARNSDGGGTTVSGTANVNINTITDISEYEYVKTDVNPLIYVKDVTVSADGTNTISFTGLPSEPIAWVLDTAAYVTSTDNAYRCISARKDNDGIHSYTIYKRNGNNACYVYYQETGLTENFNNGTLTLATNSTGNQTVCGPFLNKTYRLLAVCKNDGRTAIFI